MSELFPVPEKNPVPTESTVANPSASPVQAPVQQPRSLLETKVDNENTALNVIVAFLALAQKRGVFGIAESAKIYECIQVFQRGSDRTE